MGHHKGSLAVVLRQLDLGSSVAEQDRLLETARVETSVFADLLGDRVDLITGTKGSGKSALYRIFVDFLPNYLLQQRKVVVAHGVESHGDSVFMAFHSEFESLTEPEFVDFWCIYLVSLAHEQFIKNGRFSALLDGCDFEIEAFRRACVAAKIPEIKAGRTLREILAWALNALPRPRKVTYQGPDGGRIEVDIFGEPLTTPQTADRDREESPIPKYIGVVKTSLEAILQKADVSLWLMVDRLDEIFPRRSGLETRALRGLLKTLRVFESNRIRVKVFLRDDILEQVTQGADGFTALTHVTARHADTLRWNEDDILTLIVKRLFASEPIREYLDIDLEKINASRQYQTECFYRVFPPTVNRPPNQSVTLRWIYSHTRDAKGVVTPRDVIELLTKAQQRQLDDFQHDPIGDSDWIIGGPAIRYGLAEMSKRKRDTVLRAEMPHLWPDIERFMGKKTEYSDRALRTLFGTRTDAVVADLEAIGLLGVVRGRSGATYRIPALYKDGLQLTQGRLD